MLVTGADPREEIARATEALRTGETQCLIATRGLLGEGWDAPFVNVLVDATSVAASISTRQMRGRTLRLDPADPDKVASNWDLVCVAPELERGVADYERFVRRHAHLHAPCEDGSIESGVSHVHPELSPYGPPPAADFPDLNAHALARAADPATARARWRIGEPYRAVELPALLVRRKQSRHIKGDSPLSPQEFGTIRPAGKPRWWLRMRTRRARFPAVLPLNRVARAVVDAYVALGEISAGAAASLAWQPRAGGYVRCLLPAGSPEENARFAAALAEAVEPAVTQRYVIARPLGDRPYGRAWHPVPSRPRPQPGARRRVRRRLRALARAGRAALRRHLRRGQGGARRGRRRGVGLGGPDASAVGLRRDREQLDGVPAGRGRVVRAARPSAARARRARGPVASGSSTITATCPAGATTGSSRHSRWTCVPPRSYQAARSREALRRRHRHEAQRAPERVVGVGVGARAFEGDVVDHRRVSIAHPRQFPCHVRYRDEAVRGHRRPAGQRDDRASRSTS